ncbi:DNA glycosylase AlkZ-like family protein [Burkholderia metallica]|uniref:DNA glycosylase AlkZ-like family protein n=1 Tax=Burkholderia metallica TaxID=488729 RepID=UPI001CF0E49B|nr:crosslink repair DNA glycosylase YcaQ family protein [Burkholderia metallica]MCA8017752.1 hypothetical protein [Burkholderia metallica]
MTGRPPSTGRVVLELLEQIGPMSAREIADFLGVPIQNINGAFKVIRRTEERGEPRRIHIQDWQFQIGCGGRESAVWALGDKPDKRRPRRHANRAATLHRYDEKRRARERLRQVVGDRSNHFAILIAQVTKGEDLRELMTRAS